MPSAHSHLWSHLRFSPAPKQAGSICSIFVCLFENPGPVKSYTVTEGICAESAQVCASPEQV